MDLTLPFNLIKRQLDDGYPDDDGDDDNDYGWWWSPTGMAVRYTITLILLLLIVLYFVGGYVHARQRVRKGLAPLPYHRWMVRRYTRPTYAYQTPNHPGPGPAAESYDMHAYPPPPPAYNHNEAPPPVYQPPEGGSKILADQNFHAAQTYRAGDGNEGASSSGAVQVPPATRM